MEVLVHGYRTCVTDVVERDKVRKALEYCFNSYTDMTELQVFGL